MSNPGSQARRRPAISLIGLSILAVLLVVDWNLIDLLIEVSQFRRSVSWEMTSETTKVVRSLAMALPPMASLVAFAAVRGMWELGRTGRCPPFVVGFVLLGMVAMASTVAVAGGMRVEFEYEVWKGFTSVIRGFYQRRQFYGLVQWFFGHIDLVLPVFHASAIVFLLVPQLALGVLGGVGNERWLGLTLVLERRRARVGEPRTWAGASGSDDA